MKKTGFLLVLIITFLFSQLALAQKIADLNEPPISLDYFAGKYSVTNKDLTFISESNGIVGIYQNGKHLANVGYSFQGSVEENTYFVNSWETDWAWTHNRSSEQDLVIEATTNYNGFLWRQNWNFLENKNKFFNSFKNNTGFEIENSRFHFIIDFDEENLDFINYNGQDFYLNQNNYVEYSQVKNVLRFANSLFDFSDLIENGFEVQNIFAGNLNNLHKDLPDTLGLVLTVSKGNGVFGVGQTVVLDPIISSNSGDNGVSSVTPAIVRISETKLVTAFISSDYTVKYAESEDDGITWSVGDFNLSGYNTTTRFPQLFLNRTTNNLLLMFQSGAGCPFGSAANDPCNTYVTQCDLDNNCLSVANWDSNSQINITNDNCNYGNKTNVGDVNAGNWLNVLSCNGNTPQPFVKYSFCDLDTDCTNGANWVLDINTSMTPNIGTPEGFKYVSSRDGNINVAISNNLTGAGSEPFYMQFNGVSWQDSNLTTKLPAGERNSVSGIAVDDDGNIFVFVYFQDLHREGYLSCSDSCETGSGNWTYHGLVPISNYVTGTYSFSTAYLPETNQIFHTYGSNANGLDINYFYYSTDSNVFNSTTKIEPQPKSNAALSLAQEAYLQNIDLVFIDGSNNLFYLRNFDINGILVDFNVSPATSGVLNPNFTIDLNDTSIITASPITTIDYNWSINGTVFSNDQNTSYTFNSSGDYNLSFLVQVNSGGTIYSDQLDKTITIYDLPTGINIDYEIVSYDSTSADINFTVSAETGTFLDGNWSFTGDSNQTGLTVTQDFSSTGEKTVCVTGTTSSYSNSTCKLFYLTNVLLKIPKDSSTLAELTPFSVTVNSDPTQEKTSVSADQNLWFFYDQSPDKNSFNVVVDVNLSYYLGNYSIETGFSDFNQVIQPYMVSVGAGINVIFTALDALTSNLVPDVILKFSRLIDGSNQIVQSGVTDSTGRIALAFIPEIDHVFVVEYPAETTVLTGTYRPLVIDATNGVIVLVNIESVTGDQNASGAVDVNFLQNQVVPKPDNTVDLNQIVTSTRQISSITITVDHNGTNLYSDTNNGAVGIGGVFGQNVSVLGLDRIIPLIVSFRITFVDGANTTISKAVNIKGATNLYDNLIAAKADLGLVGGTMILSVIIVAIILGAIHFSIPAGIDNSHTFLLAATIFLLLSLVGWIDGFSWLIACLAGGAAYVLRRLPQ